MSLCRECPAACCHDVSLALTSKEADFLLQQGTKLIDITPPEVSDLYDLMLKFPGIIDLQQANFGLDVSRGEHLYAMGGDCGYLGEHNGNWRPCMAIDNPERPAICSTFPVGGDVCTYMRSQKKRMLR